MARNLSTVVLTINTPTMKSTIKVLPVKCLCFLFFFIVVPLHSTAICYYNRKPTSWELGMQLRKWYSKKKKIAFDQNSLTTTAYLCWMYSKQYWIHCSSLGNYYTDWTTLYSDKYLHGKHQLVSMACPVLTPVAYILYSHNKQFNSR